MSNSVPKGWHETTIGKITSTNSLFSDGDWVESKDQDPRGNNRLIQLADIGDGVFINKSSRFMNDEQFERLNCTNLEKGDILIARMPEPLGRACLYPLNNKKAATVVDVAVIRTSNANHYWLMSAINSSEFRYFIELNASGTTRTRIARGALSKIKLLAPPLPEQKKIAAILTSVDTVIEKTQAQIDKLKDLKTGMMQELLTKGIGHTEFKDSPVGRIPVEWGVKTLSELTTMIKSGLSRRILSQDIGIPVLISGNLQNGKLDISELKYWYVDDPQGANIENYILNDGDILVCFINSISQIGKSCIYHDIGRPAIYTTNMFRVVSFKDYTPEFLQMIFSTQRFQDEIQLITKSAVNQASFTKADFEQLLIPVPPKNERIKITNAVSSVEEKIDILLNKLTSLQNTKKALMQDLLTGKVRVKV